MIKAPRKIHKIQLMLRGIIWSSYCQYIMTQYHCMWNFRCDNGIARGLYNLDIKIPNNLGRLQNHD